jgi:hypothetical protein
MFRSAVNAARDMVKATVRRDPIASFEHEVWLWFFAGIVVQRWKDRHRALPQMPAAHPAF